MISAGFANRLTFTVTEVWAQILPIHYAHHPRFWIHRHKLCSKQAPYIELFAQGIVKIFERRTKKGVKNQQQIM